MKINEHYMELSGNYLFADIAKKVQAFKEENPEANVISLGIGDVTQPLCPAVVEALHKAADEMGQTATFRGYGPERGYDFLRNAIVENDYRARGIDIDAEEVFVSDGAKSDTGNCVTYYEKYNYKNYGSGMLLSIYTFKAGDNSYGDLNAKKILTASDGSKVVIVTPTDIECDDSDEKAIEKYTNLQSQTKEVISSITVN